MSGNRTDSRQGAGAGAMQLKVAHGARLLVKILSLQCERLTLIFLLLAPPVIIFVAIVIVIRSLRSRQCQPRQDSG
jgi:hypothetical protein